MVKTFKNFLGLKKADMSYDLTWLKSVRVSRMNSILCARFLVQSMSGLFDYYLSQILGTLFITSASFISSTS